MSVLNTFPAEKQVVNRERASKTYRVSSYYVSKMISEAPLRVVFTLIFASIVYWMYVGCMWDVHGSFGDVLRVVLVVCIGCMWQRGAVF